MRLITRPFATQFIFFSVCLFYEVKDVPAPFQINSAGISLCLRLFARATCADFNAGRRQMVGAANKVRRAMPLCKNDATNSKCSLLRLNMNAGRDYKGNARWRSGFGSVYGYGF